MSVRDLFTGFGPKDLSAGITYIKITKKNCCVMSGLHVNEVSLLRLIG
jgi:hypothetical protein